MCRIDVYCWRFQVSLKNDLINVRSKAVIFRKSLFPILMANLNILNMFKTPKNSSDIWTLFAVFVNQGPSASGNDIHESLSLSTPSDEDADTDPSESLLKHQAKFFCQMKEYLLSQQSSLRQHLEVLNATVAFRKKVTSRRQRFLTSGHGVHIPAKQKPEASPEMCGNNHDIDLMNEFHSCSSTEKSGKWISSFTAHV